MVEEEFLSIRPGNLSTEEIYKFMISAIVPRPIALVSSISSHGQGNLAPFSFFSGVSSKPPCLAISIGRRRDGSEKDTLINIKQTGDFVVNSANEWLFEKLVDSAAEYPYGVDEMQKVGLTPLASHIVKSPRVMEAGLHLECELYKMLEIGEAEAGASTLVVGRIVCIHAQNNLVKNNTVLAQALKPLARLGGISYCTLGNVLQKPVPKLK